MSVSPKRQRTAPNKRSASNASNHSEESAIPGSSVLRAIEIFLSRRIQVKIEKTNLTFITRSHSHISESALHVNIPLGISMYQPVLGDLIMPKAKLLKDFDLGTPLPQQFYVVFLQNVAMLRNALCYQTNRRVIVYFNGSDPTVNVSINNLQVVGAIYASSLTLGALKDEMNEKTTEDLFTRMEWIEKRSEDRFARMELIEKRSEDRFARMDERMARIEDTLDQIKAALVNKK